LDYVDISPNMLKWHLNLSIEVSDIDLSLGKIKLI